MRAQRVFVPIRLLNDTICLNCKDLCIEDKVLQVYAEDRVLYQHNLTCENINRCERISNDLEKLIRGKIKHVENDCRENNSGDGSKLPEVQHEQLPETESGESH